MITSVQNSKIKLVRGLLSSKKDREANGLYIIEGVRLAEEAIIAAVKPEFALFTNQLSERGLDLIHNLAAKKCEVEEISSELMDRISDTQTSQGILMAVPALPVKLLDSLTLVLVLDQVRDPGNLGTLLRSAAALGVQAVLLTPESTDAYSPKVLRSAMGAHFKLTITSMNPEEIQVFCKTTNKLPLDILLADSGKGKICWEENLTRPLCLVIGGEADGAGAGLRKFIDSSVRIPMLASTESYNAAVAGSILLYETFRQRAAK
jgi:RNA methyltransferase, TrmH family